jgi:hypothetical protein
MLPSGGHEFVCKRCKKPLEVDPTIIDNLKNIKDLDATIDTYFAPGIHFINLLVESIPLLQAMFRLDEAPALLL